jgi:hypothetical protein
VELPLDLTACTDEQHQAAIAYLAHKTTRDLRRRQSLVQQQLSVAADTLSLGNLQVVERWLAAAVDRREFGPAPVPG